MNGKTLNAGQICLAPDYMLVQPQKIDGLVAAVLAALGPLDVAERGVDRHAGGVEHADRLGQGGGDGVAQEGFGQALGVTLGHALL